MNITAVEQKLRGVGIMNSVDGWVRALQSICQTTKLEGVFGKLSSKLSLSMRQS